MKTLLGLPFKLVYFLFRWLSYALLFPWGVYCLMRRNGKRQRREFQTDLHDAVRYKEQP